MMRMMTTAAMASAFALAACGTNGESANAPEDVAPADAGETAVAAGESPDYCSVVAAGSADAAALPGGDRGAAAAARSEAWMAARSVDEGVVSTGSGLLYSVLESGDASGDTPDPGQWVCVHYRGILADGAEFDSSCGRGVPAAFPSDRLIPGWVEALQLMREGDVWELHIPPELGYGARGAGASIGPNEALVFRVAMVRLLDGPVPRGTDCSLAE